MEIKLSLPLYVYISKREKFYLNLNKYRNTHHFILNTAKEIFSDYVISELVKQGHRKKIKPPEIVTINYKFYAPDNRRRDLMNVISIVDKFALDALITAGVLADDNVLAVEYGQIKFAGVDKKNPRVEMLIEESVNA